MRKSAFLPFIARDVVVAAVAADVVLTFRTQKYFLDFDRFRDSYFDICVRSQQPMHS